MTWIDDLRNTVRDQVRRARSGGRVGRQSYPESNLEDLYRKLVGRVVWLDPIWRYPPHTNAIVAVVVRLESAIDNIVGGRYQMSELSIGVQRFCNDVAISGTSVGVGSRSDTSIEDRSAYGGWLQQTAATSDPDVYAMNVMAVAQAGIGIKERFQRAVDSLCEAVNFDPVFCIEVQNYDMYGLEGQQQFLDDIGPFLPRQVELFITCEGPAPTLQLHRHSVDQQHVMKPMELANLQMALERYGMSGVGGQVPDELRRDTRQYQENVDPAGRNVQMRREEHREVDGKLICVEYTDNHSGHEGKFYFNPEGTKEEATNDALADFRNNDNEDCVVTRVALINPADDSVVEILKEF